MKPIFTLFLICAMSLMAKSQSSCADAAQAFLGMNEGTPLEFADVPVPDPCLNLNGDELFSWYYFEATADTGITVTTSLATNTGLDTRIGIYTGLCGALDCVAFDDDNGDGFLSTVTFPATQGTSYYIVFDSYWGTSQFTSPLEFEISEYSPPPPPPPIDTLITFTAESIASSGYTDCVVDMNGDFLDDIVYVNGSQLNIFYQQAEGGFVSATVPTGPVENAPSWSIAAGDFDNNGFNDLLYGGGGGASFIWANEDGTEYTETHDNNYIFSQRTNCIDINNDGLLDGFVCHDVDANVFYINQGDGTMMYNQGGLGENGGNYGSVWIDYDNDCDMDMFIAKCGSDNIDQLHRNDGNGVFTSVGPEAGVNDATQSWSSAWADYDNDGDMDLFIGASSTWSGSHKLYENNGDGTFTNITAGSGLDGITTVGIENMPGDFNNDGWVDILGLGGFFMFNNGDMTFSQSDSPFYFGPSGDLNGDGYIDFVSGNTAYYNDLEGNNYIILNTIGTESNKNGIGARVTLTSAMGTQIRDVRSAQAFSPMQSLNTHFGIGTDTAIEMITICWPSGVQDVIYNPEINSVLTVVESTISSVAEVGEQSLSVYPNPTNDVLRIQSELMNSNSDVLVFDLTGKLVMNVKTQNGTLDVSELTEGMYVLEVRNGNTSQRTQFTKF